MTNSTDSNYQKRTSWRRLTAFALLFVAMTGAGLYAVYDRFAGRSFQFDDRLLSPALLLPVAALLVSRLSTRCPRPNGSFGPCRWRHSS